MGRFITGRRLISDNGIEYYIHDGLTSDLMTIYVADDDENMYKTFASLFSDTKKRECVGFVIWSGGSQAGQAMFEWQVNYTITRYEAEHPEIIERR